MTDLQRVFVFGSNLAGRHGKGAAKTAREHHGAIYGQGVGLQGQSYAIPTKGHDMHSLPLNEIANYVAGFLVFATGRPDLCFEVTRIGCGLAGYTPAEIAPLFHDAPSNVYLPTDFSAILDQAFTRPAYPDLPGGANHPQQFGKKE